MDSLPSIHLQSEYVGSFGTFKNEDGEISTEYVLDLCSSSHGDWAVCMSDASFRVFRGLPRASSASLVQQKLSQPVQAITFSPTSPSILYTACSNGAIDIWDLRNPSNPCIKIHSATDDELSCIDVSLNDCLLASAAGNVLYFNDIRSGGSTLLGSYSDCHSDTITKIKFHASRPSFITTAGEDGLICTYDTATMANSEAVTSILNNECPIRNFFFFGENLEGICSLSTVETMSCWHYPSAQRLCNFTEMRSNYSFDYLVDGWYNPSTDEVFCLGGDYDGLGKLYRVSPSKLTLDSILRGHRGAIRCCKPSGISDAAILTGGEDARVCIWDRNSRHETNIPSTSRIAKSAARGFDASDKPY
jgi:WD40 repeat protein